MDEKYLWPLVGVALGWFLTLVATGLKDRTEKKRSIGRLITKLLVLSQQVETFIAVNEIFKDHVDGWEQYEGMRKGISDRHFLESSFHLDSLRSAIEEIAGLYPFEALSLHRLIDLLLKHKNASLTAMSQSTETYMRGISIYEVGLEACKTQLDKIICRFTIRHGLIAYVKLRLMVRELARNRRKSHGFLSTVSKDLFSELSEFQRNSETRSPHSKARPDGSA